MPLQTAAYNTDWVFSNTSDVHVTNNKDWFFNYTPFQTKTTHIAFQGNDVPALGVGDVRLEVNTPSKERGIQAYATLVLRDVLYCPTGIVNIVGLQAMSGFDVQLRGPENSWLKHEKSGVVYLLDSKVLLKLWLVGLPKGHTSLEIGGMYYINACWSHEGRERYEAFKAELKRGGNIENAQVNGTKDAVVAPSKDVPGVNKASGSKGSGANEYTDAEKKCKPYQ